MVHFKDSIEGIVFVGLVKYVGRNSDVKELHCLEEICNINIIIQMP